MSFLTLTLLEDAEVQRVVAYADLTPAGGETPKGWLEQAAMWVEHRFHTYEGEIL